MQGAKSWSQLYWQFPRKTMHLWHLWFSYWPLHPVPSCTVQEHPAASLLKSLCPLSQTWWAALRWRTGWRKSSASSQSWPCQRSHRRTGTRRAGSRTPARHAIWTWWGGKRPGSDSRALQRGYETHHVLVEEVNDRVGQPGVAPVSMNQEKFFQVFEARYSKITCHDRLYKTSKHKT